MKLSGKNLKKYWSKYSQKVQKTYKEYQGQISELGKKSFPQDKLSSFQGRVKVLYDTASEQFKEKTEDTGKVVKKRMLILEIEHHLNRLYPQIGHIACELVANGKKMLLNNEEFRSKIELAKEYRERLENLRKEETQENQEPQKDTPSQ